MDYSALREAAKKANQEPWEYENHPGDWGLSGVVYIKSGKKPSLSLITAHLIA